MLTVIGEALIDLVETGDNGDTPTFGAYCGGSPFNVAVGLARLGQPTALMARLADDSFGRLLRANAQRNGLDLSAAPRAAEQTTLAIVSLDEGGQASYDFRMDGTADWQWSDLELAGLPLSTEILHAGSLASWLPPGDARIRSLLGRLRAGARVLLSYDPNVRAGLLGTPERGRELIEASVACVHVIKASDEDLGWLYPGQGTAVAAGRWLELGADLVVITRGAQGASAFRRDQAAIHRPGRRVVVADTVGAGDAFMAGLLDALAEAGVRTPGDLGVITGDDVLARVLDHAILVAALTCERSGADPPTRSEVAAADASAQKAVQATPGAPATPAGLG
jgi:fructokinase